MTPAAPVRTDAPQRASILRRPASLAFVMELQAGMGTHYRNWRREIENEPNVTARWVEVSYYEEGGFVERLRFLPGGVRAYGRSYLQVEQGLGKTRYDAVLFNTHNPAVVHGRCVREQRAFLMFDVTPRQYDGMARWYDHAPTQSGPFARWKDRRVRDTFQAAEGLLAWSDWAAQSAVEDYGADPRRVRVIPPGVDADLWTPAPEAERPDDGITRILFTGYAFERKGGDLLLRWAEATPKKNWELHLVTMRPVPVPPPLADRVYVHNNLGSNARGLIELAQRCDIFALPTRADCFSIASLEAMACGLPVVTTNVGGIPTIVEDGETGYLLPPDDFGGLCDRLHALIEDPARARAMGRRGRARVVERFRSRDHVALALRAMTGEE